MELQDLLNAISSVGFPIVACIGLFYLYDKSNKETIKTLENINGAIHQLQATMALVNDTLDDVSKRLDGFYYINAAHKEE